MLENEVGTKNVRELIKMHQEQYDIIVGWGVHETTQFRRLRARLRARLWHPSVVRMLVRAQGLHWMRRLTILDRSKAMLTIAKETMLCKKFSTV